MAESNRDRINPSLLDRLTDEAPGAAGGRGGSTSLSELRKSVLRDLAWLFNTTQILDAETAEAWPQVRNSVLNYGLPPLAGTHASSIDFPRLERALRQAIIDFEPRILADSVSVKAQLERDSLDHHNVISLNIAGLLWAQPIPIELLLRTQLDLESGQNRVDETVAGRK
jgi:type VI secretion system protein ImpF